MGTRAILLLCLLGLTGCAGKSLSASAGEVRLEAAAIDLGPVWVGHPRVHSIALRNEARGSRPATLSISPPFALSQRELVLPAGASLTVELSLSPTAAGAAEAELTLTTAGGAESIPVTALAVAPPTCGAAAPCHQVAFDPATGQCVETLLADGTSCSGEACLENGQCQAGVCKGAALRCDDADACTADSCGADGCVHSEVHCPAPADPCQAPRCDPKTGCAAEQAPDGTRCGPGDCLQAHVCIFGACVVRPVPDGATCGEASACADAATCQGGACVASAPRPLTERWSYAPAAGAKLTSFGSQDPAGNFYFLESTGSAPAIQTSLVSLGRDGAVRFKVPAGEAAVRGPIDAANQQLVMVARHRALETRRLADGQLKWSADLFEAMKPLFDRGPGAGYSFSIVETTLVSATTAVLNVHEDAGAWRSWAVGIRLLDGQLLWTHEHSGHLSSFVSNGSGDVFYVQSSGWSGGLTLFARNAAGVQLWSRSLPTLPYPAALSVVDGALLLRGTNQRLEAATGNPLGALGPTQAGSLSVGDAATAWMVDTCTGATCGDSVRAFDLRTHQPWWTRPVGDAVGELLLASRGIVVAITAPRGVFPAPASTLVGLDPAGLELFRCQAPEALEPSVVLDDGQLVGRLGNRIAALALPKLGPAPTGWISSRGSFLRAGRAR